MFIIKKRNWLLISIVLLSFCAYAQQPVDDQITAQVKVLLVDKNLFEDGKKFDPSKIQVVTIDKIVYLSGKVTTLSQRNLALKLVKQIPGVKTARSLLIVEPSS